MSSSSSTQMAANMSTTTPVTASYTLNPADTCWVLISTALVFIMIPGVGFYYGGMTRKKNLLSLLITSGLAVGIVSIQWFIWGFSLAFSQTGGRFIGNLDNAFLINVGNAPHPLAPTIPQNTFMVFQGMFASITPSLAFGSAAERTTMPVYVLFLFCWSTIVYDVIAYWTWAYNGWLHDYGVLDFAGGTPVHITSGFSALAYSLAVGPRKTVNFRNNKPTDISDIFLGTALLWFGWFGFNGGSETSINSRSVNAVVITNLAACFGGISWMFSEMLRHRTRRMSLNGFCAGAIAGLVAITPASGFVSPHYSIIFGIVAGVVCMLATDIKRLTRYRYDDACDVLAVHGIGGIVGNLLTGIFAENSVVIMGGDAPIKGGWVSDKHYIQLAYQLLAAVVAAAWSFVFTYLLLQLIALLPFFRLKLTKEEEEIGCDWVELGEAAYGHDLNEHDLDFIAKLKKQADDEISHCLHDVFSCIFGKSKPLSASSSGTKTDTNGNNNATLTRIVNEISSPQAAPSATSNGMAFGNNTTANRGLGGGGGYENGGIATSSFYEANENSFEPIKY